MKDHICLQTCLGSLQMEHVVVLDKARFLALEIRSNSIQVKVITAIVERGRFTVHIAPVGANLSFLIECRSIGAEKSEILNLQQKE